MGVNGQREALAALLPTKNLGTCCGGDLVGASTGVDGYAENKIFFFRRGGGWLLTCSE
jgi:hypothetical protein